MKFLFFFFLKQSLLSYLLSDISMSRSLSELSSYQIIPQVGYCHLQIFFLETQKKMPLWHFLNVLEGPAVKETHLDLTWHFSWSWMTLHLPHFGLLTPRGICVPSAFWERAGFSEQAESRADPGFLFSLIFHYSPRHVFTDSDFKVSFPKNVMFTSWPWTFNLFFFLLLNEVSSNLVVIWVSAQLPPPSGSPP